jgi:hypothetical protein
VHRGNLDGGLRQLVDEALAFLTGESDEVKRRLHALMDEASLKQDYERAASFRDRLTALSHIQSRQGINPHSVKEADVFAAHQEAGQTCIQSLSSAPATTGQSCLFPARGQEPLVEEVLESFVAHSMTISRRPSWCSCRMTSEGENCSLKPCRRAAAQDRGRQAVRGERAISSSTRWSMRARHCATTCRLDVAGRDLSSLADCSTSTKRRADRSLRQQPYLRTTRWGHDRCAPKASSEPIPNST